jgi:hypothetical protein
MPYNLCMAKGTGKRSKAATTGRSTKSGRVAKSSALKLSKGGASRKTLKGAGRAVRQSGKKRVAEAREDAMRKTSVYLDPKTVRHLVDLAKRLGRPQAQIIREAIESYEPSPGGDRNFALAGGFRRIDSDPRPISELPDEELLHGFGE